MLGPGPELDTTKYTINRAGLAVSVSLKGIHSSWGIMAHLSYGLLGSGYSSSCTWHIWGRVGTLYFLSYPSLPSPMLFGWAGLTSYNSDLCVFPREGGLSILQAPEKNRQKKRV